MNAPAPAAARNPGSAARKVLVIKLSALGDFVLALGAMRIVRETHPSAEITLLTTPPFEELSRLCPYVDRVETDGRPPNLKASADLVARIRKADYDIIYDFQTTGRTANYFKMLNMPFRKPPLWSGHAPGCAFFHDTPERGSMHTIDRLAQQLEIAGIPARPDNWPPLPDLRWVRPLLDNPPRLQPAYFGLKGPYMLLIPGASAHREAKRWPAERFGELARRIAAAGVTPVILGGSAESPLAHDILKAAPQAKNLVTRTDLFQIVGLAEQAAFVVGNDTGPMHMATLSGAPGIALFATDESDPERACPRGAPVIIVHAPHLDMLQVDTVWQAVRGFNVLPARNA